MDIANVEAAERQIGVFIERRARDAQTGRERANAEAAWERASGTRRTHAVRLVNARAWAAYHGGQALLHHDLAAQAAQKRDEYAAIVRRLETNDSGGAA